MAKVEGIEGLKAKMKKIAEQYKNVSVTVGYTAAYAMYVHENIEMKWKGIPRDPRLRETKSGKHQDNPRPRKVNPHGLFWDPQGQGQAKFLEAPARYLKPELRNIVAMIGKRTKSLTKALIAAALRLGRESMTLVPVDLENLKISCGYRVDEGERTLIQE